MGNTSTKKQKQIVKLRSSGLTQREVSSKLDLDIRTVRKYDPLRKHEREETAQPVSTSEPKVQTTELIESGRAGEQVPVIECEIDTEQRLISDKIEEVKIRMVPSRITIDSKVVCQAMEAAINEWHWPKDVTPQDFLNAYLFQSFKQRGITLPLFQGLEVD